MCRISILVAAVMVFSACSSGTGPQTTFSAQFELSGVTGDRNVPFSPPSMPGHKSVLIACFVFSPDGTAAETILYSRVPDVGTATIEREAHAWSYSLAGSDVVLTGVFLTATETQRIAIIANTDISIYQALQNNGFIVTRMLRFSKLGAGSAANCGL